MRILLVTLTFIFSFQIMAKDCLTADLPFHKVQADRFWVESNFKTQDKGYVFVYLRVDEKIYSSNMYFCSKDSKAKNVYNCAGDDDGGSFTLKGDAVQLKSLTIINSEEDMVEFKGDKYFHALRKEACPAQK